MKAYFSTRLEHKICLALLLSSHFDSSPMSSFDPFGKQPAHPLDGADVDTPQLNNARRVTQRLLTSQQEAEGFDHELRKRNLRLIPATTFDYDKYKLSRSVDNSIIGLVHQDHTMVSKLLPTASTAIPNDLGYACLRALCAAVLCLYGTAPVIEMIKQLIAYALLGNEPQHTDTIFDEHLTRSLRRWVHAIAVEEENLPSRRYMHALISSAEAQLSGIPVQDMMNQDLGQPTEISFIAGVLQWVLTPTEKREMAAYPTRSLRAWHVAVILAQFGFDVSLGAHVYANIADYSRAVDDLNLAQRPPDVVLTTDHGAGIDPLAFDTRSDQEKNPSLEGITPQIIPMSEIPTLAFRHLAGESFQLDTQKLKIAWTYSFHSARTLSIRFICPIDGSAFRLCAGSSDNGSITSLQASLLAVFFDKDTFRETKPAAICPAAMARYIPSSTTDKSWCPDIIKACLNGDSGEDFDPILLHSARSNAYLLFAIVLGSIYGICSTALVLSDSSETDPDAYALATQVAIYPDLAYPAQFRKLQQWVKTIFDLCAGAKRESADVWRYLLMDMFIARSTSGGVPAIGARQNGLTLISDFVARPTMRAEAMFQVNLLRGLPLNLPSYENNGIIGSSGYCAPPFEPSIKAPALTLLPVPDPFNSSSALSLEVVPHWQDDDRPVVLEARLHETPLAAFGLWNLQRVLPRLQPCECGQHTTQLQLLADDTTWRQVTIQDLFQIAPQGLGVNENPGSHGLKYFVNASHSENTTIFALGMLQGIPELQIVWDCFHCAVGRLQIEKNGHVPNFALVLPYGFPVECGDVCLNEAR